MTSATRVSAESGTLQWPPVEPTIHRELCWQSPITTVPRQTRGFDAKDRSYRATAYLRHQSLESGTLGETGTGASKVVIDHANIGKTHLPSVIYQSVLTPLALLVVQDLA